MDNETEREGKMLTFNVKTTRDPLSEKSGNEITRFRKTKSQQQRVGFDGLARPEDSDPDQWLRKPLLLSTELRARNSQ